MMTRKIQWRAKIIWLGSWLGQQVDDWDWMDRRDRMNCWYFQRVFIEERRRWRAADDQYVVLFSPSLSAPISWWVSDPWTFSYDTTSGNIHSDGWRRHLMPSTRAWRVPINYTTIGNQSHPPAVILSRPIQQHFDWILPYNPAKNTNEGR